MKKFITVILAVCFIFSLSGCSFLKDVSDMAQNEIPQAKTFKADGLSIDLTTDFLNMDFINKEYNFIIGNDDLTVMGEKWLNTETELGDFTVGEFAEYHRFLLEKINPTILNDMDGIPTMKYTTTADDGGEITAAVMYYKATDGFWIVTFAADTDKFLKLYDEICTYAKSVKV